MATIENKHWHYYKVVCNFLLLSFMFLKLLTIFAITGFAIINAATATVDPNAERYEWLGVPVKHLNVQFNPGAAQGVVDEFEAFRAAANTTQKKVAEYRAVREFAESLFGHNNNAPMPHHAGMHISFSTIESWISNPADSNVMTGPMHGGDRVLIVGYDLLAQVLNVRSPKPVTAQQISDYVVNAKTQAKDYQLYQLLKHFARSLPGVQSTEVDQLDEWFLENNHGFAMPAPHMHGNGAPKLKGELKVVQDLVKAKVGRDIDKDFADFVGRNSSFLERAKLYDTLEKFVMRQGNGQTLSTLMPSMAFENLEVFENGSLMQRRILPEGVDFASFLVQARTQSLQAMVASFASATHLRVFNRFVLCSQGSGQEVFQGNYELQDRLYTESQVEFSGGLVMQAGKPLTTADTTWAMSHAGELRIFPLSPGVIMGCNHSMFFQKDYVGLPIACGGHVELAGGKITKINNSSGHYMPTLLNLVTAVAHLHEQGVMADNVRFDGVCAPGNIQQNPSLAEILEIARSIEFM